MVYPPKRSRREFLYTAGIAALAGVAGCTGMEGETQDGGSGGDGSGGNGEEGGMGEETDDEDEEMEEEKELPEGVSAEEFEKGPVPDEYLTAVSIGREKRSTNLETKEDARFAEFDEAVDDPDHEPGQSCANCADFIPDKNADGFGACAEVEGYIGSEDWCSLYEGIPEPEVPEGMSEDELATAEVPELYRTAVSLGGEERESDELRTQASVSLRGSVEAISEGVSPPGKSCGNCANFIPDKNGDTWGACAEVEGYIAPEDWCNIWENLGEHDE